MAEDSLNFWYGEDKDIHLGRGRGLLPPLPPDVIYDTFDLNLSKKNMQILIQFSTTVEQPNLINMKWLCI
jgi:hypothetical protein